MSSPTENAIQIGLIQTELAKTKKISDLTVSQKRQMLQELFNGKIPPLEHTSELLAENDTVYGKGIAGINGGGFFFGTALTVPPTQNSHVDQDIQL